MSNIVIGPDTRITLHFSLMLEDGAVVESTFDKQAASFTFGDGCLLKGYEEKLLGMQAGQKASFSMLPEQGFGQHNPSNVQQFSPKDFSQDITLEEGLMVSFADASQSELAGVVKSVCSDVVEVDFNHPLAGRTILFDVDIIDVKRVAIDSIQ
ncbi:MAG: FKBP-type peptidyl-prolyl cis-trans isomerase [Spongiibacteraceae bacterium]|nr:FKBP-type peptidyl-prolyl cis-trans isomerase [Spongiibacteraceae bacterium]